MPKAAGEVWCIGRPSHCMLEIVPKKLWICECRESGSMTNLKGAVEEARRLIALSGGFAVMRAKLARDKSNRVTTKRREKQRKVRGYDSAGSYPE